LLGDAEVAKAATEGKTVDKLLRRRVAGESLTQVQTEGYLIKRRSRQRDKGKRNWLQTVSLMVPDREGIYDLNDDLRLRPAKNRNVLRESLALLNDKFDACLVDFPAHGDGPVTQIGLRACGYWLFPVLPDRAGMRDVDSPRRVLWKAFKDSGLTIRGLGTV